MRAKTPSNPSTTTVSIYNMDTKQIMASAVIPELVKYWAWATDNELGVVGLSSVFHVSIKDLQTPG